MDEIKQELESSISRINIIVNKKKKERSILAREIEVLENEKWELEKIRDKTLEQK